MFQISKGITSRFLWITGCYKNGADARLIYPIVAVVTRFSVLSLLWVCDPCTCNTAVTASKG